MSVARGTLVEEELNTGSAAVQFAFKQLMKGIWGPVPGLIEVYDPATRRARVKPAIQAQLSDGTLMSRAPLANVPVLSNTNGRVLVTLDLQEGDAVLLLCCMRGIGEFKKTYEEASPVLSGFFSASDAVALPGFGPPLESPDYRPASGEAHGLSAGFSIQTADGSTHVSLTEGDIRLRTEGDTQIDVEEECITLKIGDDTQVLVENGEVKMKASNVRVESGGQTKRYQQITAGGVTFWAFQ